MDINSMDMDIAMSRIDLWRDMVPRDNPPRDILPIDNPYYP